MLCVNRETPWTLRTTSRSHEKDRGPTFWSTETPAHSQCHTQRTHHSMCRNTKPLKTPSAEKMRPHWRWCKVSTVRLNDCREFCGRRHPCRASTLTLPSSKRHSPRPAGRTVFSASVCSAKFFVTTLSTSALGLVGLRPFNERDVLTSHTIDSGL